jgi:DNA protecting protein DprA
VAFSEQNITSTRVLLALLQCAGIGGQTTLRLTLPKLGGSQSICPWLSPRLSRPLNPREKEIQNRLLNARLISPSVWDWVDYQSDWHQQNDARIIGFYEEDYPKLLRLIPSPPPVLFTMGDISKLNQAAIAVVGTRHPSPNGILRAKACLSLIAPHPLGVISGLAVGIDQLAHQGAISQQRYTAAVLGHGLDTRYPKENDHLSKDILNSGGALITEQAAGISVSSASLVGRNRLQSGLAHTTYIVESTHHGGTLHTGRAAQQQDRNLWIPRSLRTELSEFDTLEHQKVTWLTDESHFIKQLIGIIDGHKLLLQRGDKLKAKLDLLATQSQSPSLI